ncbi:IclR family transcriptional regulator [Croceitalea marina]|uniref:IclR family transcriptional regulator n=1 Tax=Croceitalea marina TaxID=1775166 RepID=A0ABW5MX36_9FLAO
MAVLKALKSSVDKTFAILEYFTVDRAEWSVTELAKELDASKSTVYRFLSDMQKRGIMYQDPVSGKYGLGLKLFELGNRVRIKSAFTDKTHPVLMEVAKNITETVHIGVFKDEQVYYVDKVESPQGLRISTTIGSYSPAHATSLGKVLLAFSSYDENRFVQRLKRYTENTITDCGQLKEELKKIKKDGYAVDYEEFEIGLICVAVPILNQKNEIVASLSAAGPANRFKKEELPNYVKKLQKGALQIQNNIGDFKLNIT